LLDEMVGSITASHSLITWAKGAGVIAEARHSFLIDRTTVECTVLLVAALSVAAPASAIAAGSEDQANVDVTTHTDQASPDSQDAGEIARIDQAVAELKAQLPTMTYQSARYHPLHFPPEIQTADDRQCLVCHQEILENEPLASSPAGVDANSVLAWYQTLDTYAGNQMSFHQRHLTSPFAAKVMDLSCTFCHQGNDPREEHPDMMLNAVHDTDSNPPFTLRKMVNSADTCLRCHGAMPDSVGIMNLPGPWPEIRHLFEADETVNGCLSCHGVAFRTERHQVTYLQAANIEETAKNSSDVCYGCHGGRAWYRIAYPYPRTPWPLMDTKTTPEWAVGRPVESDPRYSLTSTR
jgi:hypothetical protein